MRIGICLFALLVSLAAIRAGAQNGPIPAGAPSNVSAPIQFKQRKLQREFGHDCQPFGDRPAGIRAGVCAWGNIEYPEVVSAPNETVENKITRAIGQWVLEYEPVQSGEVARTPDAVIQDFIDRAKGDGSGLGNFEFGHLDRKVKVNYESTNVLCLERDEEWYRPNHVEELVDFMNLRASTGEPIRLKDILKPGSEEALNSIAEARFRDEQDIDPTDSFEKAGLAMDPFRLDDDFAIGADGLTFSFNDIYLIGASRVSHGIKFFLPYSAFRNLLRPDANIP